MDLNDTPHKPSDEQGSTELRKRPMQARSRQRVQTILDVSAQLITAQGADQLKMSEIAKQADIPIGSVYQYFPNKSSIIRNLAESHLEKLRTIMMDELSSVDTSGEPIEQIIQVIDRIIDTYYQFYRFEPAFDALWAGVQADALLNDLETQDTKDSAELLFTMLEGVFTHLDESYMKTLALVICTQIGASLRFAMQLPEAQGDEYIGVFKDQLKTLTQALHKEQP